MYNHSYSPDFQDSSDNNDQMDQDMFISKIVDISSPEE